MKYWFVIAVVVGGLLPVTAQAQGAISQQPQFLVVDKVNEANGTLTLTVMRTVYKQIFKEVEREVVQNGQKIKVKEIVTETIPVTEMALVNWSVATNKAYDGAGKVLSKEVLFARVKAGSVVLMNSGKVDPRILALLRADVIILTTPALAPGLVPAPAPVPVLVPPQVIPPRPIGK